MSSQVFAVAARPAQEFEHADAELLRHCARLPPAQFNLPLTPSPSQMTCVAPQRVGAPPVTSYCDFAFRVYEFNRRLQMHEPENRWWEALIQEFFEDDAVLSLSLCLEEGPRRFTIGRSLIGRYFRSIYESGVIEYFVQLYHPRESFRTTTLTLECENAQIVTQHIRPMFSKVVCDGHLVLEFTCNEQMRIRSWSFTARAHHEFIPRNMLGLHEPMLVNHLSRNITRCGITTNTLNFLKLCTVLEPMQLLMAREKDTKLSPRESLRSILQERWQAMTQPAKTTTKSKRAQKTKEQQEMLTINGMVQQSPPKAARKKKSDNNVELANKKRQKADDKMNQNVPVCWKPDVLVVGEPKLLSSFYVEEERAIMRVENAQYDTRGQLFENGNGNGLRDSQTYRGSVQSPHGSLNCFGAQQQSCEPWNGFDNYHSPKNNCALPQPLANSASVHQPYHVDSFGLQNSMNFAANPNHLGAHMTATHFNETWQIPVPSGHANLQY